MLVPQQKESDRSPLKVTLNEQGTNKGDSKSFPGEEKANRENSNDSQHMLWCTAGAWGWAGLLKATKGNKAAVLGVSLPQ